MRNNSSTSTPRSDRHRSQTLLSSPSKMMAGKGILVLLILVSVFIINSENRQIHNIQSVRSWDQSIDASVGDNDNNNNGRGLFLEHNMNDSGTRISTSPQHPAKRLPNKYQPQPTTNPPTTLQHHSHAVLITRQPYEENPFALSPGELPGYTGWARPEQTLAGYFDITSLSHPPHESASWMKYHSITTSGDMFSLLLTCNHNRTVGMDDDDEARSEDDEPPYECPPTGGALFYIRAYGPSVITGIVTDFHNSSYSVELQFIDPGEYTLEVVLTFSVPMKFHEFPLDEDDGDAIEPGYEGYMVSGFPLSIFVDETELLTPLSDDLQDGTRKPWCTLSQLTETSPSSALYKGHWRVVDHVARSSHQPLTSDETDVSIDGYRMGLNSIGVRMTYDYEECELIHIRDLVGTIYRGMDSCLEAQLGFQFHGARGDNRIDEGENENDRDTGEMNATIIADKEMRRRLAGLGGNLSDAGMIIATHANIDETRINHVGEAANSNTTVNDTRIGLAGLRGNNNEDGSNAKNIALGGKRTSSDESINRNNAAGNINPTANSPVDTNEIQNNTNINEVDNFEGIHVIFIGDSVMKLVMSFFYKLVERTSGIKVTFIETNGGIRTTMNNVTSALEEIEQREMYQNVKRAIIFNSGLHDIDVLCSSKRSRSRRTQNVINDGESCPDAYRAAMTDLIHVLDMYPAELKVFRSTTAGKLQLRK